MRRRWPAEPVSWASSEEGSDPTRQLGGAGPGRVPLGRAARHTALAEARESASGDCHAPLDLPPASSTSLGPSGEHFQDVDQ